MESQNDRTFGVAEQMGAALRLASQRYAEGASAEILIDAANEAIALGLDVSPPLFVSMPPQTMVSLLEMLGSDDSVIAMIAEALLLQADALQVEGSLMEADVRREQATAVLEFIDPSRAN